MANKKIRIRPEGINDYADVLHPETSADNIIGQGLFGTTTGTNDYVVSMPNVTSLYAGLRVTINFSVSNTGASTLNVSGLGAKPIVKAGGTALTSGSLKANGVYTLVYDGTSFQLQGEGGSGNATASDLLSGKTASTDAGDIVGTLALTGDAIAGNVLSAKTFYSNNPSTKLTGTIPSKATATITPGTTNQTIASGQFLSGIQTISGDANLVSSNIRSGISIFGVVGNVVDGSTLKKWASGTVLSVLDNTHAYARVSGLSFTPSIIILKDNFNNSSNYEDVSVYNASISTTVLLSVGISNMYPNVAMLVSKDSGKGYVSYGGFNLNVSTGNRNIRWWAYA